MARLDQNRAAPWWEWPDSSRDPLQEVGSDAQQIHYAPAKSLLKNQWNSEQSPSQCAGYQRAPAIDNPCGYPPAPKSEKTSAVNASTRAPCFQASGGNPAL